MKNILQKIQYLLIGSSLFLSTDLVAQSGIASSAFEKDTSIQEVRRLNKLGLEVVHQKGGWLSAMSYHGDAYRLATQIDYKQGEADALRNIAQLEAKASARKDEALDYFLRELELREKIGDQAEIAKSCELIGAFFQDHLHLNEQAIAYYHQAEIFYHQADFPEALPQLHHTLAKAYQEQGNQEAGATYYQKAARLYFQNQDFDTSADLFLKAAHICVDQKDYSDAIQLMEKAKQAYIQMQDAVSIRELDDLIKILEQDQVEERKSQRWYTNLKIILLGLGLIGISLYLYWRRLVR